MHKINNRKIGIVFAMRYPSNIGFVWKTIAQTRDIVAGHLEDIAISYIAYPTLSSEPAYITSNLTPIEIDFYDQKMDGLIKIEKFIRNNNISIIFYMSALPSTLNLPYLRKLGIKTINTENDSFDHKTKDAIHVRFAKFIVRRLLKLQLHNLHIANAQSQSHFLKYHAMIPNNRIVTIVNGVDCNYYQPGDRLQALDKLKLDAKRIWILCVSQARKEKRIDWIINSARKLINSNANIGFIYVGDGPEKNKLEKMTKELKINNDFIFAGKQNSLVDYYQASSIMVHAASRESFGLVVVEAMACGLPVVATAAAGPAEIVEDGLTGQLVDIDDQAMFESAIERYVKDEGLRISHGNNGRVRAVSHFSIDRQAQEIADVTRKFINKF